MSELHQLAHRATIALGGRTVGIGGTIQATDPFSLQYDAETMDYSGTDAEPAELQGGTSGTGGRYSVPEVARMLGISERAVRKRITAGMLEAHKEAGAWVVTLPADLGGGTGPEPAVPPEPRGGARVDERDSHQERRIADLELDRDRWHEEAQRTASQLEHEQENVRGLIVALARAEQRAELAEQRLNEVLRIPSGTESSDHTPTSLGTAPGTTKQGRRVDQASTGEAGQASRLRSWWEWIKRH
jgi:hypothetical protein